MTRVSITKPTVGGDTNVWGTELNTLLDALATAINTLGADGTTDVLAASVVKHPLVIDGTIIREGQPVNGVPGPAYKTWGGYNICVVPNIYPSSMMLDTQAKLDGFFSQCPPNQLHRLQAYAPGSGSGISWSTQMATLDRVVNSARKYGQRLVFRLTNWVQVGSTPHVADAFDNKDATWWTSQTYKHSVSGSTSFEDWATQLAARYAADGTLTGIDLLNEPNDSSGSNTTAIASYVTYMSTAIKAVNPNVLVTMGINVAGNVGGQPQYQTIMAGADYCGLHNYNSRGFLTIADPIIVSARAIGKPYIIDEYGIFGRATYGTTADPDKDASGWTSVNFQAQGRLIERFIASTLALSDCAGTIYYSYPGTQTDGLGHYEPPTGSLGRKVIREANPNGDEFSFDTLGSNVAAWLDGAQNFRYAPGASVALWWQRHANNPNGTALTGAPPTAGRWDKHATFQFSGSQYIDQTPWLAGATTRTQFHVFVPTALPASGAYAYLSGPKTAIASGGVRINSAGQVEVVQVTGSGGSAAATVKSTSTNSVVLSQVNVLALSWDTSGGGLTIELNGVLTAATGKTATLVSGSARLGCGYDGANGFVGHLLEGIYEGVVETNTNIGLGTAYLARRYSAAI
jgi:hypothetical protein